jgi:CheY-like chemotaxis protein
MDISLIASGNMEVRPNPIDLQKMFLQLYGQFKPLCDIKNLDLDLEIPNLSDHNLLYSDEDLLRKIMAHLLHNAVKFTQKGGVIFGYTLKKNSLTDPTAQIGPGTELEFFVKDTGIGIKPEAFSLIFESFKQEEFSYSRGFEGSGLGLSIAQGLVQLLGGEIILKSQKGSGSDFSFSLPFIRSQVGQGPEETVENPLNHDKPVILIAEDDESNLFYLQALLKKKHVSVISAINGKQAVDLCHGHPEISLVLMDIKMPIMNGLQATTEIKSFRSDLKIIACTAFGIKGDEMNALNAGCDDYLTKPVSRSTLINKLKKYGVTV